MCFGWSWVFSSGRCCCCDLRVIQLNLYRASNRLLGFAPSDVTLLNFPGTFWTAPQIFRRNVQLARSQKSWWWTTNLSHATLSSPPDRLIRLVGIDHGAVEKENKENGRRAEKLLLIDLFSCTFAWFKFRACFFFHPPSLSWLLAKITHAPPTAPIKLSRDNLPTLASYFARRSVAKWFSL